MENDNRHMAFVKFSTIEEAFRAVANLHNLDI